MAGKVTTTKSRRRPRWSTRRRRPFRVFLFSSEIETKKKMRESFFFQDIKSTRSKTLRAYSPLFAPSRMAASLRFSTEAAAALRSSRRKRVLVPKGASASRDPEMTTTNADDDRGVGEKPDSPSSSPSSAAQKRNQKRVHLIRHGVTHMNMYLSRDPYGSPGFRDPLDFDTRLTPRGVQQGRSLSRQTARLVSSGSSSGSSPSGSSSSPSSTSFAVVVSPLTRALHTATLAFPFLVDESRNPPAKAAMVSLALARERVWLSSDVGRPRSALASEYPHVCFADLPGCDSPWWHGGAEAARGRVRLEPAGSFRRRVAQLREALLSRPEDDIALVSHAGVLDALTGGRFFRNCELVSVTGEELLRVDIVGGAGGEGKEGEESENGAGGDDDGILF